MSAQLSSAVGESEPALLAETIGGNFERTVAADPDREALVDVASGRRWTWAELNRDVDTLARGLVAAGLQVGDRVGIWSPNCAVDDHSICDRQDRGDPGQRQPGLPHP